jgi:hypothetical protein
MSRYTVIRLRERFINNGLDDALTHRKHPLQAHPCALDGEQEAHLIALSWPSLPCRASPLDPAEAFRSHGGIGLRGAGQPRNGAKNAQKTNSNPG